jgi:hypothetical protein
MIVLLGKNGSSFSLGQLKLLLLGDIIVPWEIATSLRNNEFSSRKGPSSPRKYMF